MTAPSDGCDTRLLDALLSGELDSRGEQRLTNHLDECLRCRESLEVRSADQALWTETGLLLKEQPFDSDSCYHEATENDSAGDGPHPPSIRHVLETLGPTDDPNMLGRLGGYEVSGVVGAGGMGVVLKALDGSLDRTVAIKVLAPHMASSGAARKRFAREAKAATAVLHPNVIAIHGVSDGDDQTMLPYLVMPYVRGSSLQARLDRQGPLTLTETLRVAAQIVDGLAAAHAQGLVHRDIKPANILLEEGIERVSITDFGLARAADDATLTHSGVIAGTPQYMSPEQARGEAIDARSDLFSLGSVIYAMCTGRAPFRAENSYGILRRITDHSPRPIREINPDVPPWLCRLVQKLHAKSPDERYQSASGVADVIHQCLAHVQTSDARLPKELRRRVGQHSSFRRWMAASACLLVLVAPMALVFRQTLLNAPPPASHISPAVQSPPESSPLETPPIEQDVSWNDEAEPSVETIQQLIEAIDVSSYRSFDRFGETGTSP